MVGILSSIFNPNPQKVFVKAARRFFETFSTEDKNIAAYYEQNPELKKRDWNGIKDEILEATASGDGPELSKALKGKLTQSCELTVSAHWYLNLNEEDRAAFASWSGISKEEHDRTHTFAWSYHMLLGRVIESIILNGWAGDDRSREDFKKTEGFYIDECRSHCDLVLKLARAKRDHIALSDEDKEKGRTTQLLKEGLRRKLAGEKVFDNDRAEEK